MGLTDTAALLARIKSRFTEVEFQARKLAKLTSQLYLDSYCYVELLKAGNRVESTALGLQALADAVGYSFGGVEKWYYVGKDISGHKMDPQVVDAPAVSAWSRAKKNLPQSALLRICNQIKKGAKLVEIRKAINLSRINRKDKEVRELAESGQLTALRAKMELMGVNNMLAKFYGRPVDLVVLDQVTGDTLMESHA